MNRRQIFKGIAASALVAGFNGVSRRWVRAAEVTGCAPCLPFAQAPPLDRSYPDYALAVDAQIEVLRAAVMWDSLVKPWFDVWLPDTAVEGYVGDVLTNLTPRDVGAGGFILIFAQKRSRMTRPFLRLPREEGEGWVWLFDITTTSMLPGPDSAFAGQMLERNRQLFERARDLGGTRYPIGAQAFTRDDWVRQYGEAWPEFARRKRKYDSDNVLTPGPGIF